ncbi:Small integral membrane protein 8 [Bagarius yarrelli]|uniref:Small integral membrane protein 8 n=1 Tax=Bagarius yarrelli TaxID=175774 RepID=A0A556VWL0_BAGYA|nr:Small integral membrane protein 8 [Bagarius yarrelli]
MKEKTEGQDSPEGSKCFVHCSFSLAGSSQSFGRQMELLWVRLTCRLTNKPVMALGLVSITLCVGYLGYLHAVKENQSQELYEAVDSEGERYMRRKTSRWD